MSSNTRLGLCLGLASMLALTNDTDAGASPPSSDLIEAGRTVYQQHCAACHGLSGEGAPNWEKSDERGELPPPPHGPEGHTWRHADAMLKRMISQGWRDPFNQTQRLTMPAFEGVLTPKEIESVITYLKTLWTPEQRAFQRQESRVRSSDPAQSRLQEQ